MFPKHLQGVLNLSFLVLSSSSETLKGVEKKKKWNKKYSSKTLKVSLMNHLKLCGELPNIILKVPVSSE